MDTTKEKLYQEFIEVTNQLSELTLRKKTLADMVMAKLNEEKIDKVESSVGMITRVVRKLWEYPTALKQTIDSLQKECQENGTAKQKETEFLKVTLR